MIRPSFNHFVSQSQQYWACQYHNYNNNMRGTKVPKIFRHPQNHSITLSFNKPKKTLIWLHGAADEADTYLPFFTHLQSPLYNNTKIVLLQAPSQYFSLRQTSANIWFDMRSTKRFAAPEPQVYDLQQLQQTSQMLASQCREEEQYWQQKEQGSAINPQHRIYVGGFSQGAITALHYALSTKQVPAGVIAASGHLLKYTMLSNLGRLPILLMHGKQDKTILQGQAKSSYAKLLEGSQLVDYQQYLDLEHTLTVQQLIAMRKWLQQSFSFISEHYSQQSAPS